MEPQDARRRSHESTRSRHLCFSLLGRCLPQLGTSHRFLPLVDSPTHAFVLFPFLSPQHRAHYKFDLSLTTPQNGFTFAEIHWHRIRVRDAILQLRKLWGQDVPLMFRTRQLRKKDENFSIMKIFQLDQSCKSVARELGVKLFSWGEKLEGYTK